jgi:hypothetical protein
MIADMKAQWKILDEHKRGDFSLAKNIKKKLYKRRLSQTNQCRQKLGIFLKEMTSYRCLLWRRSEWVMGLLLNG